MKKIIAIVDGIKVTVLSNLTSNEAGKLRFELSTSDENINMFGEQICIYRTAAN